MENNTVKQDNRKALPKYLLIVLAGAVFGGVVGFAAGWLGHDGLSEIITAAVTHALTAAAPWALLATSVAALAVIFRLYRGAGKLFAGWDGEEETAMDRADEKLSWALLVTSAQLVLDMFFFAAAVSGDSPLSGLTGVLVFVLSVFLLIFAQQKIVDLTRRMNPEKKGSVYDMNFRKKWMESCDEAERMQIGRAAHRAFTVTNSACPLLWMALVLAGTAFNCNILLPVFMVCLVWLLLNVSYCLECIRLSRGAPRV